MEYEIIKEGNPKTGDVKFTVVFDKDTLKKARYIVKKYCPNDERKVLRFGKRFKTYSHEAEVIFSEEVLKTGKFVINLSFCKNINELLSQIYEYFYGADGCDPEVGDESLLLDEEYWEW